MKFSLSVASTFLFSNLLISDNVVRAGECAPDPLEFSETMALKVEKVGSVPAIDTNPFTYNLAAMDNFDGNTIFFLDQNNGLIYCYDSITSETKTMFDISKNSIPAGLTLDWTFGSASATYRVKSMTQGTKDNQAVVVFTSSTLPVGWSVADATLPAPGAFGQWACDPDNLVWIPDVYRMDQVPACFNNGAGLPSFTGYDVFYKYEIVDGELVSPVPFFVSETNVVPGHLGGGIATIKEGVLWSTGDCMPFGVDGSYAPQLDSEACGKILLIDPDEKGEFKIAAKGVRNSQQMRVFSKPKAGKAETRKKSKKGGKSTKAEDTYVAFMDIGGVTAEEVNAFSVHSIKKATKSKKKITNFGWGRNINDGKAREGTFYVDAGMIGVLGTEPPCAGNAPVGESGYTQPWTQFGRTATDFFYAISSLALPTAGTDKLKLLWAEFNTGKILGTDGEFVEGAPPATGYKLKLYDADGNYLENGLNDLVKEELGEVGYYRGDPRLFHFPDGCAGVLMERTGVFYKLTEMAPM